jgi:hypothetical protein
MRVPHFRPSVAAASEPGRTFPSGWSVITASIVSARPSPCGAPNSHRTLIPTAASMCSACASASATTAAGSVP